MQKKYTSEKLNVILLSTDHSRDLYDSRASALFEKYGGGDWPSILFENSFKDAMHFGDFGYGKVIVEANGIVRSIGRYDFEAALEEVFRDQE